MERLMDRAWELWFAFQARRETGQGLVEYALILVLIAIVVIAILTLLGRRVSTVFSTINSGLGG